MKRLKARRRRTLSIIWVIAMAVAIFGQHGIDGQQFLVDGFICLIIVLTVDFLYRRVVPSYRRSPIIVAAPLTALMYMGTVIAAIVAGAFLFVLVLTRSPVQATEKALAFFHSPKSVEGISYAFGTIVGITFLLELSRRIGPGQLGNWLMGRYRSPREETRLFLFIDLTDSTPLAEQLGALKFSYLLQDFFDDLTDPVLASGGQIVSYVGDEAIIVWRHEQNYEESEPIRCFMLFRERIQKRAAHYRKNFGLVPQFKGAVHAGPVVVTEVGQIRTEVVYHGDALNTAARILGECSRQKADLLISEPTLKRMREIPGTCFEPLGKVALKGKGEPVPLARVRFASLSAMSKLRRRES